MYFILGMGRYHYFGNDSGYLPKPSLRVHGNGPFPACLFLDLDLMAAIVSGIRDMFKIKIKIDAEFVGIAERESRTAHLAIHLGSTGFVDTQSSHYRVLRVIAAIV